MLPADRHPDWKSAEFWRWAADNGPISAAQLSRWFPEVAQATWSNRVSRAKACFGVTVGPITRSTFDGFPADPPPGWPERDETPAPVIPEGLEKIVDRRTKAAAAPAVELTTDEKIALDRENRRLRAEVSDLRERYDRSLTENDLEDRIIERVTSRVPSLPPCGVPTYRPRNPGRSESVVALVSDYHIGERVDLEATGGINAYDFDVFRRRWQYHVDSVGGICLGKLTGYDFPELRIVGLGDMVSGIIHDELVETSDTTLIDWLIDGSDTIARGIRQLAAEFPTVRVDWLFGNHGRVTQKPRYKNRFVNYDHLMGHIVSLRLADLENVTFTNHRSFWALLDVQGHNVLALHGDNIKGWGGLPSYGINRAVANLSALLNSQKQRFDTVCIGHFHQTGLIERTDCDIVLNGSAIGANEYSLGALFAGGKPRQMLFGMHPERGRTWTYAVDLSNGDAHECRL